MEETAIHELMISIGSGSADIAHTKKYNQPFPDPAIRGNAYEENSRLLQKFASLSASSDSKT